MNICHLRYFTHHANFCASAVCITNANSVEYEIWTSERKLELKPSCTFCRLRFWLSTAFRIYCSSLVLFSLCNAKCQWLWFLTRITYIFMTTNFLIFLTFHKTQTWTSSVWSESVPALKSNLGHWIGNISTACGPQMPRKNTDHFQFTCRVL